MAWRGIIPGVHDTKSSGFFTLISLSSLFFLFQRACVIGVVLYVNLENGRWVWVDQKNSKAEGKRRKLIIMSGFIRVCSIKSDGLVSVHLLHCIDSHEGIILTQNASSSTTVLYIAKYVQQGRPMQPNFFDIYNPHPHSPACLFTTSTTSPNPLTITVGRPFSPRTNPSVHPTPARSTHAACIPTARAPTTSNGFPLTNHILPISPLLFPTFCARW